MSWATCYSGSNNYDKTSPPLMSDGRNYASYTPDAEVNNKLKKDANITSNWEYRQYLQQNAKQIMQYNTAESCYASGINTSSTINTTPTSNVPFLFNGTSDTRKPPIAYNNNELKNPYLTRESLNSRMISPSINTDKF